jgi:hypothetical protein
LREAEQRRGEAHEIGPDKKRAQEDAAYGSCGGGIKWSLGAPNLRSRGLDKLTVANSGRTDRLASAAVEAFPHLLAETGAPEIEARFANRLDETNPAARSGRFCHSLQIGGAGREAQTAPNASVEDGRAGLVSSAEAHRHVIGHCRALPSPCMSVTSPDETGLREKTN